VSKIWPIFPNQRLRTVVNGEMLLGNGALPVREVDPSKALTSLLNRVQMPKQLLDMTSRVRMTLWLLTALFSGIACISDSFLTQACTLMFCSIMLTLVVKQWQKPAWRVIKGLQASIDMMQRVIELRK
jgi:hypothetical protein